MTPNPTPAVAVAQPSAKDKLHAAICQAVSVLNLAPEVARLSEGRQVSAILRQALADYADDFMNKPASEKDRAVIRRKHGNE